MAIRLFRNAWFRRSPRLGERLGHGADNALLLRHLAASLVIYGHAYALTMPSPGRTGDLLSLLIPGFYAGSVGVCIFFALSGCLIARSWLRHPKMLRFARARFLRIYPAFLLCLLLSLGLVGPLFSDLGLSDYFSHAQTHAYLTRNLDLIGLAYVLPEAFARNPVPGVVNGSLWSLSLVVRLYLVAALLGVLGNLARPRWFALLIIAYVAWNLRHWLVEAPDHQDKAVLTLLFMLAAGATLIKRRNRHDACRRADRGALAQMHWLCFKPVQQRDARRQGSPNPLFLSKQVESRRSANRTARLAKATSLHFATQHVQRTF